MLKIVCIVHCKICILTCLFAIYKYKDILLACFEIRHQYISATSAVLLTCILIR